MTTRIRLTVAAVLACLVGATACTSAAPDHPRASASAPPVARWWSAAGQPAGGTIDASHPRAGAADLHPSRKDYCAVLRQTLAAGKSILPDASAADPRLRTAIEAFVADVEKLAPAPVTRSWQVLGTALVAFVGSQGKTLGPGADTAAVQRAASAISADAKAHCGLDLTRLQR